MGPVDLRYSCANHWFQSAAEMLASHPGGIHARLSSAISNRLEHAFRLAEGPLPDLNLEHRRAAIAEWFRGRSLASAIDILSKEEAEELAREIASLAEDIRAAHERRPPHGARGL